jgi:hypothetical protein
MPKSTFELYGERWRNGYCVTHACTVVFDDDGKRWAFDGNEYPLNKAIDFLESEGAPVAFLRGRVARWISTGK